MKKYPLEKIDAFSAGFSTGNPAALVALDCPDDITPEQIFTDTEIPTLK